MTDVSAGFRPPCWCPCTWAPAWRLHTNLYKFGENVSSHIFYEKNCRDLNLGESLCICTFFLFPDSGLTLLNGFDFLFRSILSGLTLKTSNILHFSYIEIHLKRLPLPTVFSQIYPLFVPSAPRESHRKSLKYPFVLRLFPAA